MALGAKVNNKNKNKKYGITSKNKHYDACKDGSNGG
jgi:hypothetical protein